MLTCESIPRRALPHRPGLRLKEERACHQLVRDQCYAAQHLLLLKRPLDISLQLFHPLRILEPRYLRGQQFGTDAAVPAIMALFPYCHELIPRPIALPVIIQTIASTWPGVLPLPLRFPLCGLTRCKREQERCLGVSHKDARLHEAGVVRCTDRCAINAFVVAHAAPTRPQDLPAGERHGGALAQVRPAGPCDGRHFCTRDGPGRT